MEANPVTRRNFIKGIVGTVAGATVAVPTIHEAMSAICGLTPAQTEGPFYPVQDQLDKDNDLTFVMGKRGRAKGQLIYILGQVTDQNCNPVQGALLEIWQACESGKYNHPGDPNPAPLDENFQYWGKAVSDDQGNYVFKTILPGHYPATNTWIRPPHIHFKIGRRGFHELTTQMYFDGNEFNEGDKILRAVPRSERSKVVIPMEDPTPEFDPESKLCRFNISIREVE